MACNVCGCHELAPLIVQVALEERIDWEIQLPFAAGRCALRTCHPDNMTLIANALRWASRAPLTAALPGHEVVLLSLRQTESRLRIHLANTTGGYRYLSAFTPVRDLEISLIGA